MADIDLNEADEQIMSVLEEGRNTPSNIARRLEYTREYVSQRLKRLREHGVVERVDRGLYALPEVERHLTEYSGSAGPKEGIANDGSSPEVNSGESAGAGAGGDPTETVEEQEASEDVREQLREAMPSDGETLERRVDAVFRIYDEIRQREGEIVRTQDLKDLVDADEVGYSSVDSFWNNAVKANNPQGRPNALTLLPGVEELGNGRYQYTDGV